MEIKINTKEDFFNTMNEAIKNRDKETIWALQEHLVDKAFGLLTLDEDNYIPGKRYEDAEEFIGYLERDELEAYWTMENINFDDDYTKTLIEDNLSTNSIMAYRKLRGLVEDYSYEFSNIKANRLCFNSYSNTVNQVRSLFTSICIIEDLEADTNMSDLILADLYSIIEKITDYSKEEFENFMLDFII